MERCNLIIEKEAFYVRLSPAKKRLEMDKPKEERERSGCGQKAGWEKWLCLSSEFDTQVVGGVASLALSRLYTCCESLLHYNSILDKNVYLVNLTPSSPKWMV